MLIVWQPPPTPRMLFVLRLLATRSHGGEEPPGRVAGYGDFEGRPCTAYRGVNYDRRHRSTRHR